MSERLNKIEWGTVSKIFDSTELGCYYNSCYRSIHDFFEQFEFGNIYQISGCGVGWKKEEIEVFSLFGINFSPARSGVECNYVKLGYNDVRYYLKSQNSKNSEKLLEKLRVFGERSLPTFVDVDGNLGAFGIDSRARLVDLIRGVFSVVHFMNWDLKVIVENGEGEPPPLLDVDYYKTVYGGIFFNCYEEIAKACFTDFDVIQCVKNLRLLMWKMVNSSKQARLQGTEIVYFLQEENLDLNFCKEKRLVENGIEQTFLALSVLLGSKYGCKFVVGKDSFSLQQTYNSFLRRKGNLFSYDYLKVLADFPDVSIYRDGRMAYYLVLDKERLLRCDPQCNREFSFAFSALSLEFDISTGDFTATTVHRNRYFCSEVEPLDLAKVLGLPLVGLNSLLARFESILRDGGIQIPEILHQGNVLLFRDGDRTFFGYISGVKRRLPFVCYPAAEGWKSFPVILDNSEDKSMGLGNLQSIFMDFRWQDSLRWLAATGANFSPKRLKFWLPKYSDGIAYLNLLNSSFSTRNCEDFLDDSTLGIWSVSCAQFRKDSFASPVTYHRIVDLMNLKVLRENETLTFFGGPHPSISTTIEVKPSILK